MPTPITATTLMYRSRLTYGLELRSMGLTYQEIADTVWDHDEYADEFADGLWHGDKSNCYRDIRNAYRDMPVDALEDARTLELMKLDKVFRGAVEKGAFDGDKDAASTALRVIGMKAKILGLEAPTQIHSSGGSFEIVVAPTAVNTNGMSPVELEVDPIEAPVEP